VATTYSQVPFDTDRLYKPLDHSEIGRPKILCWELTGEDGRRRRRVGRRSWRRLRRRERAGRCAIGDDDRRDVFGVLFRAPERWLGADGGGGRRRTPASNSDVRGALCNGKPVKEGRYNKGKRKGEKGTAGKCSTTLISSSSRAPMVTAVPNSGEKFGDLEAIFSRDSKGE
jgi:hypothetical protein